METLPVYDYCFDWMYYIFGLSVRINIPFLILSPLSVFFDNAYRCVAYTCCMCDCIDKIIFTSPYRNVIFVRLCILQGSCCVFSIVMWILCCCFYHNVVVVLFLSHFWCCVDVVLMCLSSVEIVLFMV